MLFSWLVCMCMCICVCMCMYVCMCYSRYLLFSLCVRVLSCLHGGSLGLPHGARAEPFLDRLKQHLGEGTEGRGEGKVEGRGVSSGWRGVDRLKQHLWGRGERGGEGGEGG